MTTLEDKARLLEQRGVFLGGPLRKFEAVGRDTLGLLRRHALRRDSTVLDVGCGCLRIGYWLIDFLDAGRYCGIEPNVPMLEAGIGGLLEPGTVETKRPRFDHNNRFDFAPFAARFDFVVARSIWTHAAPAQIATMLDQFAATAAPNGVFFASYKPCRFYERSYAGSTWVGSDETKREGGTVRYRFCDIAQLARARALEATELDREHGQVWIRIARRRRLTVPWPPDSVRA
jgi:SAM-dependent methyltransferase